MATPVTVWIALGSNLGNRRANLRAAVRDLAPAVRVRAVSALYESDPAGVTDQPPFLNAVVRGETALAPEALLDVTQAIEWTLGRRPGLRWGPRPIDLDLLACGEAVIATPRLTLPHPRIGERAFVLRPLADLAPGLRLPGWTETVAEALAHADGSGLERVASPEWAEGVWA